MSDITAHELELMKHACGMGSDKPHYRNYFMAAPGAANDKHWQNIVESGLGCLVSKPSDTYPYNMYRVTKKGIELLQRTLQRTLQCTKK